jgi:hypothetical protein
MQNQHAKLSASGSYRWMTCPGSVSAEEGYPEQTSSFAQEGTDAHSLAEYALVSGKELEEMVGEVIDGVEVTSEMSESLTIYTDFVRSFTGHAYHEVRVDFSEWVCVGQGFGTADCIILDGNTLRVIDLKYGRNKVEANENSQLMLYALGAYAMFHPMQEITQVVCTIVQPRIGWIDEYAIDIESLLKWGEHVKERALATQEPNAMRNPSEKACHFCKAKAQCPALAKHVEQTILCNFDDISSTPGKLTDEQLKTVFDNTKLIEGFLEAVAITIRAKVEAGTGDKFGLKLVAGRTTRKWADESTAEKKLEELLGDEAHEVTLLSPAKAEKALGKKGMSDIADLIEHVQGSPVLAPVADKRQAINPTDSSVFD